MSSIPGNGPSDPGAALEFEITDFGDAKRALDEPPPGVGRLQTFNPGYWKDRRRKAEPSDRALTGAAIDWMVRLPMQLRPKATSERFPRIVNALAGCWARPQDRDALLQSLLVDQRGQRAGLPPEVRAEIQALHDALAASRR